MDERLRKYAQHIERLEWSALILDSEWRLVWVSPELKSFVGAGRDSDLGYGLHVAEAFLRDQWMRTVHPESYVQMFSDLAPFFLTDFAERGRDPKEILPDEFLPMLDRVEAAEIPAVLSTSFLYLDPAGDTELPEYRVNMFCLRLHDDSGELLGWLILCSLGIRPNLLALLARGDDRMYERMARLVEPSPHRAAILFCDLHRSGRLSRQLPSAVYFKLVRRLWTGIDRAVAGQTGIIGKHAGDGASAFFLVDDLGSPSATAAAAVRAAALIHEVSEDVFRGELESECLMKVGLHWGDGLYMGQLVPGSRLDVSALGDEVNEAARVQETAGPGETLATKQLVERLSPDDAAELGIDPEKLFYQLISELPGASEKAVREVGGLPVTTL